MLSNQPETSIIRPFMFETLTERLGQSLRNLRGVGRLSEENMADALKEVRSALLACKVQENEDADPVEGYHVLVGGGFGPHAALGRELYRDVRAEDAPRVIERILKAYVAHRASKDESFLDFAHRHEVDVLKAMTEEVEVAA